MSKYVALLRAINVGGNSIIKMADLSSALDPLGFTGVATYIQSGNILFGSADSDSTHLAQQIQERLESAFGQIIQTFVFSPGELREAASNNPFEPAKYEQERRCHLMFLSAEPDTQHIEKLMALQGEEYRFSIRRKVLYYTYPKAFDGKRRMINFEKVLGVSGTSRTWQVVNTLIEMAGN